MKIKKNSAAPGSGAPTEEQAKRGPGEIAAGETIAARRSELEGQREETAAELEAWQQEQSGFTSMSRLGRAAAELVTGNHSVDKFVRQAGDPEAFGDSPLSLRLKALDDKLDLVDRAKARLTQGVPPLDASELGVDLVLDEIAAATGRPLSRGDLVAHRSAHLARAIESNQPQEALESYVALSALYLEAPDAHGESVHRNADGPSLTSLVNGWILSGRLRTKGRLVVTADDLDRLSKKIVKLSKRLQREGQLPEGAPEVSKEKLALEVERLRRLESSPSHRALLEGGVAEGHARFVESVTGDRATRFGKGVLRLLDEPSTWAMVLMGALAGTFGRVAMARLTARGATASGGAVTAKAVDVARRGGQLTKATLGRFVATRAAEGVGFHTGMNLFEHARQKHDRASWGLGAYARSVALFQVLGGVQLLHHAQGIESALVRHAVNLGEETLGLSLLGLGECWLRGGDSQDALEILEGNLQFLLAMRLLSGARWVRKGFPVETEKSLGQQAREADRWLRAARNPSYTADVQGVSAKEGFKQHIDYLTSLARETEALHATGELERSKADPPAKDVVVDGEGLEAAVRYFGFGDQTVARIKERGYCFAPQYSMAVFDRAALEARPELRREVANLRAANQLEPRGIGRLAASLRARLSDVARARRVAPTADPEAVPAGPGKGSAKVPKQQHYAIEIELTPRYLRNLMPYFDAAAIKKSTCVGEATSEMKIAGIKPLPEGILDNFIAQPEALKKLPAELVARLTEGLELGALELATPEIERLASDDTFDEAPPEGRLYRPAGPADEMLPSSLEEGVRSAELPPSSQKRAAHHEILDAAGKELRPLGEEGRRAHAAAVVDPAAVGFTKEGSLFLPGAAASGATLLGPDGGAAQESAGARFRRGWSTLMRRWRELPLQEKLAAIDFEDLDPQTLAEIALRHSSGTLVLKEGPVPEALEGMEWNNERGLHYEFHHQETLVDKAAYKESVERFAKKVGIWHAMEHPGLYERRGFSFHPHLSIEGVAKDSALDRAHENVARAYRRHHIFEALEQGDVEILRKGETHYRQSAQGVQRHGNFEYDPESKITQKGVVRYFGEGHYEFRDHLLPFTELIDRHAAMIGAEPVEEAERLDNRAAERATSETFEFIYSTSPSLAKKLVQRMGDKLIARGAVDSKHPVTYQHWIEKSRDPQNVAAALHHLERIERDEGRVLRLLYNLREEPHHYARIHRQLRAVMARKGMGPHDLRQILLEQCDHPVWGAQAIDQFAVLLPDLVANSRLELQDVGRLVDDHFDSRRQWLPKMMKVVERDSHLRSYLLSALPGLLDPVANPEDAELWKGLVDLGEAESTSAGEGLLRKLFAMPDAIKTIVEQPDSALGRAFGSVVEDAVRGVVVMDDPVAGELPRAVVGELIQHDRGRLLERFLGLEQKIMRHVRSWTEGVTPDRNDPRLAYLLTQQLQLVVNSLHFQRTQPEFWKQITKEQFLKSQARNFQVGELRYVAGDLDNPLHREVIEELERDIPANPAGEKEALRQQRAAGEISEEVYLEKAGDLEAMIQPRSNLEQWKGSKYLRDPIGFVQAFGAPPELNRGNFDYHQRFYKTARNNLELDLSGDQPLDMANRARLAAFLTQASESERELLVGELLQAASPVNRSLILDRLRESRQINAPGILNALRPGEFYSTALREAVAKDRAWKRALVEQALEENPAALEGIPWDVTDAWDRGVLTELYDRRGAAEERLDEVVREVEAEVGAIVLRDKILEGEATSGVEGSELENRLIAAAEQHQVASSSWLAELIAAMK